MTIHIIYHQFQTFWSKISQLNLQINLNWIQININFYYINSLDNMIKNQSYEFVKGFENGHTKIGFGSYGEVKLARNIETKQLVAIKLVYSKNVKQEIFVHSKLEHPNIIKLLNYYYEKQKNITYMVLEYADGGTLFQKIKTANMSKQTIKKIFREVCEATNFIHKNNFMHRDIKPENILLTKNNQVKLCDFGFASFIGQRNSLCGTYQYMAPQMIQNMPYDYKIDIWALGILFFQMIGGVAPFRGENAQEVLKQMKKNIYFTEKFQQEQINLIKSILRVNPCNRPSIDHILQHPYFKSLQKQSLINNQGNQKQFVLTKRLSDNKNQFIKKQIKNSQLKFDKKFYKLVPTNLKNIQTHNNFTNNTIITKTNSHIISPQYANDNRIMYKSPISKQSSSGIHSSRQN